MPRSVFFGRSSRKNVRSVQSRRPIACNFDFGNVSLKLKPKNRNDEENRCCNPAVRSRRLRDDRRGTEDDTRDDLPQRLDRLQQERPHGPLRGPLAQPRRTGRGPARPHDPRREELPAGHTLRLRPRAARLAAHRGVEERGLEGRHRQHRRDAQRRGQEPAHDAASGLRLHGPRRGEEHDPALVRRADPAGHPRRVHQRGHPRPEPQPRHAAPGAHRHRIDLEPGAGAPCGRDRRTRSPGPGLPERLRPDPRRGARSPLGPRRGVLRRRPVPDRRTGHRDGPRHPVAGRRLDAQTLRGLQRPEGRPRRQLPHRSPHRPARTPPDVPLSVPPRDPRSPADGRHEQLQRLGRRSGDRQPLFPHRPAAPRIRLRRLRGQRQRGRGVRPHQARRGGNLRGGRASGARSGSERAHELLAPGAVHPPGAETRRRGTPLDGGRGPARARGPAGQIPSRALRRSL